MTHERDRVTTVGLYVVGGAAAVMSFTALADLAWLLGVRTEIPLPPWRRPWEVPTVRVAWLLPLAVDVFAFTAARVVLRGRAGEEAVRVARRAAWAAIGTTVALNGLHGALTAPEGAPGYLVVLAVVVSAIPAVALGALVHLAHLVGRAAAGDDPAPAPGVDSWGALHDDALAEPWRQAVVAWAATLGADRPSGGYVPTDPPDRAEPNEVLAADLREDDAARRAAGLEPRRRDAVRERYGVGASRAERLRELADAAHQPPALTAVPIAPPAEVPA